MVDLFATRIKIGLQHNNVIINYYVFIRFSYFFLVTTWWLPNQNTTFKRCDCLRIYRAFRRQQVITRSKPEFPGQKRPSRTRSHSAVSGVTENSFRHVRRPHYLLGHDKYAGFAILKGSVVLFVSRNYVNPVWDFSQITAQAESSARL